MKPTTQAHMNQLISIHERAIANGMKAEYTQTERRQLQQLRSMVDR